MTQSGRIEPQKEKTPKNLDIRNLDIRSNDLCDNDPSNRTLWAQQIKISPRGNTFMISYENAFILKEKKKQRRKSDPEKKTAL